MKANVLDMLVVLFDEADEEDVSGCGWLVGWLAGWQPNQKIRRRGTLTVTMYGHAQFLLWDWCAKT